ncbi:hypothetical protein O181_016123 [Austropuccinia psidii MF-1]|uniref:Retrotransposon gag domain-containing protein n=1 Tax=Austropuccinia psidii MF-1 TaxID=1389203 RepID=A0A9Q3GQK5_9BASI|nr:hypothetical protein [Austropuccinia psidii MF-1]
MQKMTQLMDNLQESSDSDSSRPPAFKNSSMKAPDFFDGTQPFKVKGFIQSCKLIFHTDLGDLSQYMKKDLYSTSFLIGRSVKWIEPYLSTLTNQDPNNLLDSWPLFEYQLFTLFGDPNEVRKAKAELNSLIMKECGNFALYISHFQSLVSTIRDWGERALIHHFRKGLASSILYKLASHHSRIDSLQSLMDIKLELDTRNYERQKEKILFQEKKPEVSKEVLSHCQNYQTSNQKKNKNSHFQKRNQRQSAFMNKYFKLMGS